MRRAVDALAKRKHTLFWVEKMPVPGTKAMVAILAVLLVAVTVKALSYRAQNIRLMESRERPPVTRVYADATTRSIYDVLQVYPDDFVFFGDSQVFKFPLHDLFRKYRLGANPVNRGICGDGTAGLISRMGEISTGTRGRMFPRKVFFEIGTNDLFNGMPQAALIRNYEWMIRKIRRESPATEIYASSIIPVRGSPGRKSPANDSIASCNARLRRMCAAYRVTFVNAHDRLADGQGQLSAAYDCGDHVHLNGRGYQAWFAMLRPYLE